MRPRHVKTLLTRDLKKIEVQLVRAFQAQNNAAIIRCLNEFANKAKEYKDFIDSLR